MNATTENNQINTKESYICPIMKQRNYKPPVSICDENEKRIAYENKCHDGNICLMKIQQF